MTIFSFILLGIFVALWIGFKEKKSSNSSVILEEMEKPTQLLIFKWEKAEYMRSQVWKLKRYYILHKAHYKCEKCGVSAPLHVHHLSGYNLIPNEPYHCLVALCEECHNYQHQVHGYPQTYDDYMNWNVKLV